MIIVPLDSTHSAFDTVTSADMPLIQRIANLPEYHDCQRFVVPPRPGRHVADSALRFGPLVAIWAADSLGSRFGDSAKKGPSLAVPVAIIHNLDLNATYLPLQIQPGFSCLYLWHNGGSPRLWKARIVSLGPKHAPCQDAVDPGSLGGPLLKVRAELPKKLSSADIPEVARWDWDSTEQKQFIGIRCAQQWCEVFDGRGKGSLSAEQRGINQAAIHASAASIAGITNGLGTENEGLRVVRVKGWYDEQRLDLRDSNGKPVLTNIVGTVIPHPALARAKLDGVRVGEWTPVAFIHLTANYPGKVPLRAGLSRVFLCRDTNGECQAPTDIACEPEPEDPAHPTAARSKWWMRIEAADNSIAYHCVRRRTHGGKTIPAAAARWNWYELDAKTWVQCGTACCTVN
ncbi:MAG TPA: hypothetical protein VFO06_04245 [Gemmatimonadales bacterium]|nr:hypothetical protein [Gemmatimonadales bacterium]